MNRKTLLTKTSRLSAWQPKQAGQALVTLLVIVAVGMSITTGAVITTVLSLQNTSTVAQSQEALRLAEAGVENAMRQLHRNPSYSGETLTLPAGTATIVVTGSAPTTIQSVGQSGSMVRKIQVTAEYSNTVLNITEWQESN